MSSVIIASLYEKYQNIILCFSDKYRHWNIIDSTYNEADFGKSMNSQKYIMNTVYNPEDEKFIYVVLFHTTSPYLSKTDIFRKFLDLLINKTHKQDNDKKTKFLEKFIDIDVKNKHKIISRILNDNKKYIETIFITKRELTTYFLRNIQLKNQKTSLVVHNYLHKHFIIEIGRAPLCSRHTRLTKSEASDLLSRQLMTSPYALPRIKINDPHVIWCGAKVNEIIRIEVNSELAGKCLRYRLVVPISGKVEQTDIFDDDDDDDDDLEDDANDDTESDNDDPEVEEEKKEEADEPLSDEDDFEDVY